MSFFSKHNSDHHSRHMSSNMRQQSGKPIIQPPFNETGTIIGINGKFLHGFLAGIVAYFIWPSDPKWWGFGLIAVILWAACICSVFAGLRALIKLRSAKKRWARLEALGSSPKNARLAGKSDLQNKGMN